MSTADGGVADAKEKTADEQSVSLDSRAEVISRSVDEAFHAADLDICWVEERRRLDKEGSAI